MEAREQERVNESMEELQKLLREDSLRDCKFVILFTKKDLKETTEQQMLEKTRLKEVMKGRVWDYLCMSIFDESLWNALDLIVRVCGEGTAQTTTLDREEKREETYYTTESGEIVRILENGNVENVETYEIVDVDKKSLKNMDFKEVEKTRAERMAEGTSSLFLGWLKRKGEISYGMCMCRCYFVQIWRKKPF